MATFLDVSILEGASSIFGFLLIFALTYGVLKFSGLFKNSDGLNAIVAVSLAIMSILSPGVMEVIRIITPWYTLLMYLVIMIVVITVVFGGLGGDIGSIKENMGANNYKTVITWIIVLAIIIFISGVASVFLGGSDSEHSLNSNGENYVEQGAVVNSDGVVTINGVVQDEDGLGTDAFMANLFHPKMIGAVLFLFFAGIAVLLLGYTSVK